MRKFRAILERRTARHEPIMIDIFDIITFFLFGGIVAVMVQVVVTLGSLPGRIAQKRNHPQAEAISIASWLGLATLVLGAVVTSGAEAISFTAMGFLWPLALVFAFLKPIGAGPPPAALQSEGHNRPEGKVAS
jgi:Protein of unknown function (DUF3302)